ncbi:MAG: carboxypeptidase family protein [Desulfobacteraceae bacterium]|nr:carboxypeptidase family protein [Desulfobacteraceae bacterium]
MLNIQRFHIKIALVCSLFLIFIISIGCIENSEGNTTASISINFESGSIGQVHQISDTEFKLALADDNDNPELPSHWRNWWYVSIKNLSVDQVTIIHLSNRGWPYYYLPVYSYDNKNWNRFSENEVFKNPENELIIEKQFEFPTVWIARFYPYTYSDLQSYLQTISDNPFIDIGIAGTTQEDYPIHLITVTDFDSPDSEKKRIWMHARSHPAEICPSFLIEGLINYLLTDTQKTQNILKKFIFNIVPMHNVDGVIAGNYRTTTQNENLEVMWFFDIEDPVFLTDEAPKEVRVLHQAILELIQTGPPIDIALNLHASNSEPGIKPFFYAHFGTQALGYNEQEASLWKKQLQFIDRIAMHYGADMLEPAPDEGGDSFATKFYPESWWWHNFQDQVMAITIETTYGQAGYSPSWVEPDDYREMGKAVALAIRDYYDEDSPRVRSATKHKIEHRKTKLKYPELYPPHDPNELKE